MPKRQKILVSVKQAMKESAFGSTRRADMIDSIQTKFMLSSADLRTLCLFTGGKVDYWNR